MKFNLILIILLLFIIYFTGLLFYMTFSYYHDNISINAKIVSNSDGMNGFTYDYNGKTYGPKYEKLNLKVGDFHKIFIDKNKPDDYSFNVDSLVVNIVSKVVIFWDLFFIICFYFAYKHYNKL